MFYNFCKIQDESSQEIYLSQEGLHLLLAAWSVDFQDSFNPVGIYIYTFLRDDVPQNFPFLHPKMRLFWIQRYVESPAFLEDPLQVLEVLFVGIRIYSDVIQIDYDKFVLFLENSISITLWKVSPAFIRPKGILAYMNVPHGVVKVVFSRSSRCTKI
jgi:hypothetical protein